MQLRPRNPEAFPGGEDVTIPPPVLFQGPRKRKTLPKDKAAYGHDSGDSPTKGRGRGRGRSRSRGRGRGAAGGGGRGNGGSGKGKAKAGEGDSDSQGDVNYDNLDGDSDDAIDEPGPSLRRTSRQAKKTVETQNLDLAMLERLESMEIEGAGDE